MSDSFFNRSLSYGRQGHFSLEMLSKRVLLDFQAPHSIEDPHSRIAQTLALPVDFPPIHQAFVPGDRVVVVLEDDTPLREPIVESLIEMFARSGLSPERIHFLEPASIHEPAAEEGSRTQDLVLTSGSSLVRHDAEPEENCTYLANTASGERIYLSRELNDADAVITVGPVEFHPVLGVRGTVSGLYPGLSRREDLARANARGHDELGPEDARPLRQKAEEVAWLLGLQISVAVVPATGQGACEILAGQCDSVFRRAKESLRKHWTVRASQRAEMVIVSVPADARGHDWHQVAAAIDVGRRLVERNGRIVVLSELNAPPGPAMEILRQSRGPRDALKPIERSGTADLLTASRIAAAADWANVSLLSQMPPELIEELFLLPLESPEEAQRLIQQDDLTAVVENAQHCFVHCNF